MIIIPIINAVQPVFPWIFKFAPARTNDVTMSGYP